MKISAVDDTALDGNQTVTITAKPTYTGTNLATDTGNATTNINIIDNESPSLKVVIDKDVISETGTATATITRNTDTSSDLTVTLNSSDTTEATVPNTVTIAADRLLQLLPLRESVTESMMEAKPLPLPLQQQG
ncbi:MAG UNVERIFIED_CONTAM: hypothetical protein LVR29_06010 [Microcystis novacekii LVE1205-3]